MPSSRSVASCELVGCAAGAYEGGGCWGLHCQFDCVEYPPCAGCGCAWAASANDNPKLHETRAADRLGHGSMRTLGAYLPTAPRRGSSFRRSEARSARLEPARIARVVAAADHGQGSVGGGAQEDADIAVALEAQHDEIDLAVELAARLHGRLELAAEHDVGGREIAHE